MFRRLAIGLAVAALIALPASQSSAGDKDDDEGFIGVGANFTWDNYKTPILRYTGTDVPPGLSSLDYGGPNFGGAFHWGITNKLVLTASLDFGFFSHTVYPYPASGADDIASVTANYWQIGAMLGVKYFFKEPEAGKVSLYLAAGIGKYFAGTSSNAKAKDNQNAIRSAFYDEDDCTTFPDSCDGAGEKLEDDDLDDAWDEWVEGDGEDAWEEAEEDDQTAQKAIDAELEMAGDLASPFVAQIAVGAEFFATDTFSIGADILGLRFAFASSDVGKVKGTDQDTGTWTGEQKYVNLYIYSGLTMNFNLTGGEATPKKEEEPVADDGWGTPASGGGANDSWGSGGQGGGGQSGWGGSGGWSTGPAAPTPAPQPSTQPAPQPAAPAPTPGAPAPVPGQPGGDIPPPPPPPPPPPA